MIQELKKYCNWKNPTSLFCIGLLSFLTVSVIDLMVYETTPGLRMNYVLALVSAFVVGKGFWIWNYYSKKIPNLNFLHVEITTAITFLLVHPTAPWWVFPLTVAVALFFKSLLRYKGQPIFNPAAFGVYMSYLLSLALVGMGFLRFPAIESWWGADFLFTFAEKMPLLWMLSIFFIMFFIFSASRFRKLEHAAIYYLTYVGGYMIYAVFIRNVALEPIPFLISFFTSSYVFLAFIMVAEPKTSPVLPKHQVWLGVVGGLLLLLCTNIISDNFTGVGYLTVSTFPLLLLNLITFYVKNHRSLAGGTPVPTTSPVAATPGSSTNTTQSIPPVTGTTIVRICA